MRLCVTMRIENSSLENLYVATHKGSFLLTTHNSQGFFYLEAHYG